MAMRRKPAVYSQAGLFGHYGRKLAPLLLMQLQDLESGQWAKGSNS